MVGSHGLKEEMKFVVFLGVGFHAGGMYQYTKSLMEILRAEGCEVIVIASDSKRLNDFSGSFDACHVASVERYRRVMSLALLPLSRFSLARRYSRILLGLEKYQRQYMRDCYWLFPAQDYELCLIDSPKIGTIHDLMHKFFKFPEVSGIFRTLARNFRYRSLCKFAEYILVDSLLGAEHVRQCYGRVRNVFPVHYSPSSYIEYLTELPRVREMQLDNYIVYPAQLWAHKNHERLISAFAIVAEDNPELKLVLTGSSKHPRFAKLLQNVERQGLSGKVIFLGRCEDGFLNELINGARGLIMPSFFGPTNIPPLEAASLGVPIAVSDLFECWNIPGSEPILFSPTSVKSIAEAICELLKKSKLDRWDAMTCRSKILSRTKNDVKNLLSNLT